MDAIKYLKIRERLCRNNKCESCPLYKTNNGTNMFCTELEEEMPGKMVKMVEKWAEEHPGKTRMDEFLEEHPNADVARNQEAKAFLRICPIFIDVTKKETHNCSQYTCNDCRVEYWNEEAEE